MKNMKKQEDFFEKSPAYRFFEPLINPRTRYWVILVVLIISAILTLLEYKRLKERSQSEPLTIQQKQ